MITSLLGAGLVDRIIVSVAPIVIGDGTEAVGALGVTRVADGIRLTNRAMFPSVTTSCSRGTSRRRTRREHMSSR